MQTFFVASILNKAFGFSSQQTTHDHCVTVTFNTGPFVELRSDFDIQLTWVHRA